LIAAQVDKASDAWLKETRDHTRIEFRLRDFHRPEEPEGEQMRRPKQEVCPTRPQSADSGLWDRRPRLSFAGGAAFFRGLCTSGNPAMDVCLGDYRQQAEDAWLKGNARSHAHRISPRGLH